MDSNQVTATVESWMPEVVADLGRLVSHASVAFPGFPDQPVTDMASETMALLKRYGFTGVKLLEMPAGHPAIWAEMHVDDALPTALLYGHYDVQPAEVDQGWKSNPWKLTQGTDGRLYGRGAADDKSGIMIHAGAIRALGGKPPVNVKLILEGDEEAMSHLEEYVEAHPSLFQADVMVIADMGNLKTDQPVLTTSLRGDVSCVVTVSTLKQPLHSGLFGGPAPDALVALIRTLATLHDEHGNVAIEGLQSGEWDGADFPADDYRAQAGMLDGVELIGEGSIASRLWSKPSVTVIGLDAPKVDAAANILIPSARARLSMRVPPGQDADDALGKLARHLETHVPWGANVVTEKVKAAPAFKCEPDGPVVRIAREALSEAYGSEAGLAGSGGSIPLLTTLAKVCPTAEFLLIGAEDFAKALIHGVNESVDPTEIEKMIVAETLILDALATSRA